MQKTLCILLVIIAHGVAVAQDSASVDTSPLPEWRASGYDQAEKIYNGLYLTPMENPAMAGFDRQLVASYGGGVKNLSVGLGHYKGTPTPAFWGQRALIDFAFAGKRKNVGVAVMYQGGREYKTDYHVVGIAHSYRFHIRRHRFTLGLSMHYAMQNTSVLGPTGDQIDSYYGFIYESQEIGSGYSSSYNASTIKAGVVYDWKRLFISYCYRFGVPLPSIAYGRTDPHTHYHLLTFGYHVKLASGFTLSPWLSMEHGWGRWSYSPTLMVTWKDRVFASIGAPELSHVRIDAGIQFWNRFRVAAGVGFYHQDFMQELNGMAYAGGSLRYMLPIWGK